MDFLKELFPNMKQYEDQEDDELEDLPSDEEDNQLEDLPPEDDETDEDLEDLPPEEGDDEEPNDDLEDLPDDEEGDSNGEDFEGDEADDKELDEISNQASEDPDRQGVIRSVKGARLVYKRQCPDGTFEELWIYNSGKQLRDELKIRQAIVADTDIIPGKMRSADGSQSYSCSTMGNAELIQLVGLQN
jgi:hypothetical protein